MTAETGRQPWIVYGKLLTARAVSPLKAVPVLVSLILFIAFYLTLLSIAARYVVRAVREGPATAIVGPAASLQPAPLPNPAPASEPRTSPISGSPSSSWL